MESSRIQKRDINYTQRMRIHLQLENHMLRAKRIDLAGIMAASPLECTICNALTVPHDHVARENEQRFKDALLRSELETLTCFKDKLDSLRSRCPKVTESKFVSRLSRKEVISLARIGTPIWTDGRLDLNRYYSKYFPWYAKNIPRFIHEASRAYGLVPCDASSLVTNLMNPAHWKQIFPTIVADVSVEEHRHYQVITVEFMSQISSLVPNRNVKLRRCAKHIDENTWVIADISMYFSSYAPHLRPDYLRFPSGYVIEHIANGVSKVTVLDHWVYKEEETINKLNQNSGIGAQKWLAALERHCYNTCFDSVSSIGNHIQILDPINHTNLLNLSKVMVNQFCTGVCGPTKQNWNMLITMRKMYKHIRMSTRESQDMSGVPCLLVSATGTERMQAKPEVVFGVINRARKQDIWNCYQPVGDMQEVIRIKRSHNPGNEVSVYSFQEWYMIQETFYGESEAMIIHACVEASYFMAAINGGDFTGIDLLPCGFTIAPFRQLESVVGCAYQVTASQATIVTSSEKLVEYLDELVADTLENVANGLF